MEPIPIKLHDSWNEFNHQPGDAIWSEVVDGDGHHRCAWENCSGRHLMVCLPSGDLVDLSQRASNCTRKDDRTHRCWVIRFVNGKITVDKQGDTCNAGAGSILVGETKFLDGRVAPGWHGFLRDGMLVEA